ncbi:MAG: Ger(x)C family spore germination protein [Firmicutes bacterium]|nr:Ger(x)C family spore germination protein [Bacillota bacterium]
MKPWNKKVLAVLLLSFMSCAGGCWNYRELDQLGIVSGVGFDLAPETGKILLTIQVIKPGEAKAGGGGGSSGGEESGSQTRSVVVVESTGATVFDAVREAVTKFSRKLFWPHNQVLIIGKEAAEQGVRRFMDFEIRDAEPRPTAWVMVTPGKAGDLLKAPGKMEKIPAMEIAEMLRAQSVTSKAGSFMVHDFVLRLLSKTAAPVATQIRLNEKNEVQLGGTAVFIGEKLTGFIGKRETRGLLWVLGKVKSGIVTVKDPDNKGKVSLEVIRSSSKIKTEVKGDSVRIKVTVSVRSNVGNQNGELDLSKLETLKSLARREETAIRNEIKAALDKARELKADIFGFGEAVRRDHPKAWKRLEPRWDEIFTELQVDLTVKANINQVGLIIKPIKP